jgi:hypothetical protein
VINIHYRESRGIDYRVKVNYIKIIIIGSIIVFNMYLVYSLYKQPIREKDIINNNYMSIITAFYIKVVEMFSIHSKSNPDGL